MTERLQSGDARVGDVVTPLSSISQHEAEPRFRAGERLTVTAASARSALLTVMDDGGKSGTWSCSCFRFVEPRSAEQLLHRALGDVIEALAPLTVVGRPVVSLDTALTSAVAKANTLLEQGPGSEVADLRAALQAEWAWHELRWDLALDEARECSHREEKGAAASAARSANKHRERMDAIEAVLPRQARQAEAA